LLKVVYVRASLIHLELDNYKDFTELKDSYLNLIKPREKRPVDYGKNHYSKKYSRKCYNCGAADHVLDKCPKPILKCSGCGYYGHNIEECKRNGSKDGRKEVGKYNYNARGLLNKASLEYPCFYLDTCATDIFNDWAKGNINESASMERLC
jgi:hypothetical protein